jgi:hypothetical protein
MTQSPIVTFSPRVLVLRVYERPPPAPYALSLLAVLKDGTAELEALAASELTPAQAAAIREEAAKHGIHTLTWDRRDPITGNIHQVSVSTGLPHDHPSVLTR